MWLNIDTDRELIKMKQTLQNVWKDTRNFELNGETIQVFEACAKELKLMAGRLPDWDAVLKNLRISNQLSKNELLPKLRDYINQDCAYIERKIAAIKSSVSNRTLGSTDEAENTALEQKLEVAMRSLAETFVEIRNRLRKIIHEWGKHFALQILKEKVQAAKAGTTREKPQDPATAASSSSICTPPGGGQPVSTDVIEQQIDLSLSQEYGDYETESQLCDSISSSQTSCGEGPHSSEGFLLVEEPLQEEIQLQQEEAKLPHEGGQVLTGTPSVSPTRSSPPSRSPSPPSPGLVDDKNPLPPRTLGEFFPHEVSQPRHRGGRRGRPSNSSRLPPSPPPSQTQEGQTPTTSPIDSVLEEIPPRPSSDDLPREISRIPSKNAFSTAYKVGTNVVQSAVTVAIVSLLAILRFVFVSHGPDAVRAGAVIVSRAPGVLARGGRALAAVGWTVLCGLCQVMTILGTIGGQKLSDGVVFTMTQRRKAALMIRASAVVSAYCVWWAVRESGVAIGNGCLYCVQNAREFGDRSATAVATAVSMRWRNNIAAIESWHSARKHEAARQLAEGYNEQGQCSELGLAILNSDVDDLIARLQQAGTITKTAYVPHRDFPITRESQEKSKGTGFRKYSMIGLALEPDVDPEVLRLLMSNSADGNADAYQIFTVRDSKSPVCVYANWMNQPMPMKEHSTGISPLLNAIVAKNTEKVKILIVVGESPANPNQISREPDERDINLNFMQAREKTTPLMVAVQNRNWDIANILFKNARSAADANLRPSKDNFSPLDVAIKQYDTRMVQLLLENKANPNSATVADGRTPIATAFEYFDADVFTSLFNNRLGNSPNVQKYISSSTDFGKSRTNHIIKEALGIDISAADKKFEQPDGISTLALALHPDVPVDIVNEESADLQRLQQLLQSDDELRQIISVAGQVR